MRKMILLLFAVVVIVIGFVVLRQCSHQPSPEVSPQEAVSEEGSLLVESSTLPLVLELSGPQSAEIGQVVPIVLRVVGQQAIGDLVVEVSIAIDYLQVDDHNPDIPGTQVVPAALPEGTQVTLNELTEEGILRYRITGLGARDMLSTTICVIPVQPIATGIAELTILSASLKAPDGTDLTTPLGSSLLLEIRGAAVAEATPIPMPVLIPTPTPVPPPLPVEPAAAPPTQMVPEDLVWGIYYRIQPGQNLFRLGLTFGTTAEEIAAANGIADMRSVPAKMLLRIPVAPPRGQAAYLVSSNETLYGIANTFGMTVEGVGVLNQIMYPYQIQVGQWLVLRP